MSEFQNVVIVGASIAGHTLANSLMSTLPLTHRIILIDSAAYAYFPIAALRASVVPGWEDKIIAPLNDGTVFPKGSQHRVIAPNKVVDLNEGSVVLEDEWEGQREIPFVKCILAVGSSQPRPMRGNPSDSPQQAKAVLVKEQQDVAKATKIVVIGGGAVGIEWAGEVRAAHTSPSITIVHSPSGLLNPTSPAAAAKSNLNDKPVYNAPATNPKLSKALDKSLAQLNIKTIFNVKADIPKEASAVGDNEWDGSFGLQDGVKSVKLSSGEVVEGDYFFIGIGNKYNTEIVRQADAGALGDNGMIWVDDYFKVKSSSPASPLTGKYYALGDANSMAGWKTAQTASADAAGLAAILVAEIKGTKPKAYKRGTFHGMMIPLGPNGGAGYATMPLLGDTFFPEFMIKQAKASKLFVDMLFESRFKGSVSIKA